MQSLPRRVCVLSKCMHQKGKSCHRHFAVIIAYILWCPRLAAALLVQIACCQADWCLLLSCQENARKVSRRLRGKPRHPAQLAADIVERVIATGGEHYLETHAHTLSRWQLSLLDVKAFLAVAAILAVSLLAVIVFKLGRLLLTNGKRVWHAQAQTKVAKGKTA